MKKPLISVYAENAFEKKNLTTVPDKNFQQSKNRNFSAR